MIHLLAAVRRKICLLDPEILFMHSPPLSTEQSRGASLLPVSGLGDLQLTCTALCNCLRLGRKGMGEFTGLLCSLLLLHSDMLCVVPGLTQAGQVTGGILFWPPSAAAGSH